LREFVVQLARNPLTFFFLRLDYAIEQLAAKFRALLLFRQLHILYR